MGMYDVLLAFMVALNIHFSFFANQPWWGRIINIMAAVLIYGIWRLRRLATAETRKEESWKK